MYTCTTWGKRREFKFRYRERRGNSYFVFEGGSLYINGFEGWREFILEKADNIYTHA